VSNISSKDFPETADIETASEDYARRFSGKAGHWMLQVQSTLLQQALTGVPSGSVLVDVGGGHAQTAPVAASAGFDVRVTGSDESCRNRLPETLSFDVADNLNLPYEDQQFPAVLCFRLVPHCDRWPELLAELCRVSSQKVIIDYPTSQSVNKLADKLFSFKKKVEKNTRPFTLFRHSEIEAVFVANGFRVIKRRHQFFWPMVVHRMLNCPPLSKVLEAPCRRIGLTRLWGSPVILEAERV
jgi:hypothetical protein